MHRSAKLRFFNRKKRNNILCACKSMSMSTDIPYLCITLQMKRSNEYYGHISFWKVRMKKMASGLHVLDNVFRPTFWKIDGDFATILRCLICIKRICLLQKLNQVKLADILMSYLDLFHFLFLLPCICTSCGWYVCVCNLAQTKLEKNEVNFAISMD